MLDNITSYAAQVKKFPLLTADEEKKLTQEYVTTKSNFILTKLINHNLRLVLKIAYEYKQARSKLMDLIQEGNIGLIKGVEKFDPSRGVPLASYVALWIRAYILRFILSNAKLIRLGTTTAQQKLFFNLGKEQARLSKMGIEPTDELIAERLNVDVDEVTSMRIRMTNSEVSTSSSSPDSEEEFEMELPDYSLSPDQLFITEERNAVFEKIVNSFRLKLADDKKTVNKKLLVFERRLMVNSEDQETLEDIAKDIGVTKQRVQQIEADVKARFQKFVQANYSL